MLTELTQQGESEKYYRKRKQRFRHAINTIICRFVKLCHEKGVARIVVGDVSGIRENNNKGRKINAMVHNFWSFRYVIERLRTTAENFGIEVEMVNEHYTSSICPRCGSKNAVRHKRLFKCLNCGLEAHRDVVGALNIAVSLWETGLTGCWHTPCFSATEKHKPPHLESPYFRGCPIIPQFFTISSVTNNLS